MKLALSKIVVDDTIYPRTKVNTFHVRRLRDALQAGAKLPPLIVEHGTNRLVDGRHRHDAYAAQGVKTVDVEPRKYASEAELFADAVRLNVAHGEGLDRYTIRNAIIRLSEMGFEREQITEIVRVPAVQVDLMRRGFAIAAASNKPIALKGGLSHLSGEHLDEQQMEVNKHYAGGRAVLLVRQIIDLLENDMWPINSQVFPREMDRLTQTWESVKRGKAA